MQKTNSWITLLAFLPATLGAASPAPGPPVGVFEAHADVGTPALAGGAGFDEENQQYVLSGGGTNMWSTRDELHFAWKRLDGDFLVRARVEFLGRGFDPHRKIGWIARSSLDADSPYVDVAVHGDGLTSMQFRRSKGAETEELRSEVGGADVVQLARRGDTFTMSVARFGEPFETRTLSGVKLPDAVLVGLFVCSHNPEVTEKALFRNVRIVRPAGKDLVAYRDYLASNLEVLDLEAGHRRIVFQVPDSLQAPNWTTDGKALIYNRNGRLYRFDLERREAAVLDTGFAIHNNNDHVLSFDGRWIGISHHAEEHGGESIVYLLPSGGGEPRQVTPNGPSYFHGWSPDAKFLVYTGGRGGNYDIYKIPVAGGEEVRLTEAPGLDDGPEYSPDGRFIYFNSTRSGKMELWRMKPDGGSPEQLTDDPFNNWFPHLSPDGKEIVFLSYGADVDPGDHPFYKEVYLRRMPAAGGEPEVVAYVYGGQGTINVPSWSPDGTRVAFVSNTGPLGKKEEP